ncbi:MAG: TIM-barrel domain-containing protein [Fimbriimonadales bacterium]
MIAAAPTELLPGVWIVRFGSPEKLTPLTYRSAPIAKAGFAALSAAKDCPVAETGIVIRQTARGCTLELPMTAAEKFYGLGMSNRTFELSGRKAWVTPSDHPEEETNESHGPEPFFVSSRGYGIYVDTARYASFSFGNVDPVKSRPQGEKTILIDIPGAKGADVYIFGGPTIRDAVQRYNLFSGGGCVPPLWGLGMAYRGKGDFSASDFLALAKSFRDTDMPCDIFGVEPGWQTKTYSSSFVWNQKHFPDPDGFIKSMQAMDYRMSFWEQTFVHPSSPMYEALKEFAGSHRVWGGLVPDFASRQGRKIYVDRQKELLISKGVESFKIDEVDNQPFKSDPWSFPDGTQFPSGLDGEQMHSLYGTLAQQALLEPYRITNRRTWGLVRESGGLAAPLPYTLYSDTYDARCYVRGLAKMGFGGHMWVPEVRDANNVEDLIRRCQAVIFSPYAMLNCWYMKMPPWLQLNADKSNAGVQMPEAAETTARVRKLFKLRMSLIPYLYSAFNEYHQTGLPVIRALVVDYPDDAQTAAIDDQFMFGPSILVAPMIEGQKSRSVYLPTGDWVDFFTGEKLAGGKKITATKSLDEMPLYVKANTLLPLAAPVNHVSSGTVFDLTVRVYGDHPSGFTLYEDDGETYDFENGAQNRLTLSWSNGTGSIKREGPFKPVRYRIDHWEQVSGRTQ